MKHQPVHYFNLAMVSASLLMVSRLASADMPPIPYIADIIQKEQDVKIRVKYEGNSLSLSINRTQGAETKEIVSRGQKDLEPVKQDYYCDAYYDPEIEVQRFCESHPNDCLTCSDGGDTVCVGKNCDNCRLAEDGWIVADTDFCNVYPEYGQDCDDDGTPDCCMTSCMMIHYYDFWDYCVPPEPTTYEVFGANKYETDIATIDVKDNEDACLDEDTESEPASTDGLAEDTSSEAPLSSDEPADDSDTSDTASDADDDAPLSSDEPPEDSNHTENTESDGSGCQVAAAGAGAAASIGSAIDLLSILL